MPPLLITMGDPAGIGPEIVLQAHQNTPHPQQAWIYIADPKLLPWMAHHLQYNVALNHIDHIDQAQKGALNILATHTTIDWPHYAPGMTNAKHAATILESIATACHILLKQPTAAMITPPIHKGVLHLAGYTHIPGHTELLAQHCGQKEATMMLLARGLRVVPTTIHQSLASVATTLTPELVTKTITTTHTALQIDFAIPNPKIMVAALNPHAGENGAFGREEVDWLAPLCQQLREQNNWHLRGPLSADTLFHRQARQEYDVAICMYHDQALIPIKTLAFGQAVNVTLGLPIVRTSVDHGTAFNIAGQGIADWHSFVAAAKLASQIARNRQKWQQKIKPQQ